MMHTIRFNVSECFRTDENESQLHGDGRIGNAEQQYNIAGRGRLDIDEFSRTDVSGNRTQLGSRLGLGLGLQLGSDTYDIHG